MVPVMKPMPVTPNPVVAVAKVRFGNALPLALIAGPCVLESRAHAFEMASALKDIAARRGVGFVYKTSFDKANRTSGRSARGVGLDKALSIFAELREKLGVPVLTDVHEPGQCAAVAEVVDVLQIPAFLCRQTDLLIAAAKTGRAINVKKGQFLAPWDMANVVEKITGAGNRNVLVTERGVSFGYNTLVSDMRALPVLAKIGAPVIFSTTLAMSQGARNCPFFTLIARPVLAAAIKRSVCRQRNAGICKTSTTSATAAHWPGSCTSVSTGTPSFSRSSAKIASALSRPMPRALLRLVRFALSNEVL